MMTSRGLIALTMINLGLLIFTLAQQPRAAAAPPIVPGLRGRMLEIVDDRGRVRASIKIEPAGTSNEQPYPETVMFRLFVPNGGPGVKLGASAQGSGLGLAGAAEPTYVTLKAEGPATSLRMTDRDGRQLLFKP